MEIVGPYFGVNFILDTKTEEVKKYPKKNCYLGVFFVFFKCYGALIKYN